VFGFLYSFEGGQNFPLISRLVGGFCGLVGPAQSPDGRYRAVEIVPAYLNQCDFLMNTFSLLSKATSFPDGNPTVSNVFGRASDRLALYPMPPYPMPPWTSS
jgi:hypothetical protein